jgi:hypothetical protein
MSEIKNRMFSSGLLSKEASFRLWVQGPVSVKELDVLIARITMDRDFLAEDERPSPEPEADETP